MYNITRRAHASRRYCIFIIHFHFVSIIWKWNKAIHLNRVFPWCFLLIKVIITWKIYFWIHEMSSTWILSTIFLKIKGNIPLEIFWSSKEKRIKDTGSLSWIFISNFIVSKLYCNTSIDRKIKIDKCNIPVFVQNIPWFKDYIWKWFRMFKLSRA